MNRRHLFTASFLSLWLLAPLPGQSQTGQYIVEWPADRQSLLEGRYSGTVRDSSHAGRDCEFSTAELDVLGDNRYAIDLRCREAPSRHRRLEGSWWIDEIAGSCLILVRPGADASSGQHMYGFRIVGAAVALVQDGGGCQAADERDRGMILHRQPAADASR